MLPPVVNRPLADPVLLCYLRDRRFIRLAHDRDHLLFRESTLLHDFLSLLEVILSSFNWAENSRASHMRNLARNSARTYALLQCTIARAGSLELPRYINQASEPNTSIRIAEFADAQERGLSPVAF